MNLQNTKVRYSNFCNLWPLEQKEVLEELYLKQRLTPKEISEIIDEKTRIIRLLLNKYEIPTRSVAEASKMQLNKMIGNDFWKGLSEKQRKTFLYEEYINKKKSLSEVSKTIKISSQSVLNYLNKWDITPRTRKIATQLKAGVYRLQDWTPTKKQEQILYGSLMGDGCLLRYNVQETSICFVETHGLSQKDYLRFKSEELKDVLSQYKVNKTKASLRTSALPYFAKLRKLFYSNNKKTITQEILDKIEPLGLAIWYMDDGGSLSYKYKYRASALSTQGFSVEENKLIQQWLKSKWNIDATLNPVQGGCNLRLRFNVDNAFKLMDFISPYIRLVPCMNYKIALYEDELYLSRRNARIDMKKQIIILHKKGLSVKEIAKNLDKHIDTIYYHLRNFRNTDQV